jgi:hypothetical protein
LDAKCGCHVGLLQTGRMLEQDQHAVLRRP